MKHKRFISAAVCLCTVTALAANSFSVMGSGSVAGDANGDGAFNVADLVLVRKYIMGNGALSLSASADVNKDGAVDSFDFALIRKSLTEKFPDNDYALTFTAENLCDIYSAERTVGKAADEEFILGQTEFALELLRNTTDGTENALISPYSVMQALAMTANGADGSTKAEMEEVLGGIDIDTLNEYLCTWRKNQGKELSTANSIWTVNDDERISVYPEFIQKNVDYYNADIFKAPFDDTTVKDINSWVYDNTDGMIPKLLEDISSDAVMYLINAVALDIEWQDKYYEHQVGLSKFTAADGTVQDAEVLNSRENYYIQDENASGVYKYYRDRKYAFAAILPDEGVTLPEYIAGLTPERLSSLLAKPEEFTSVVTSIPKFSYDYDVKLKDSLSAMGMNEAFDVEKADFTGIGKSEYPLFISNIIHKTSIELSEEGTRAAAVTSVELDAGDPMPMHEVIINRPFLYCIVDTQTNLPVFIGTVASIPQ